MFEAFPVSRFMIPTSRVVYRLCAKEVPNECCTMTSDFVAPDKEDNEEASLFEVVIYSGMYRT